MNAVTITMVGGKLVITVDIMRAIAESAAKPPVPAAKPGPKPVAPAPEPLVPAPKA